MLVTRRTLHYVQLTSGNALTVLLGPYNNIHRTIAHFAITINSIWNPLISICGQTMPCLPVVWLLKLSIKVNKHCAFGTFGTCRSDSHYGHTLQMKDIYFITFHKEKLKPERSKWRLVRAKALLRITSTDTLSFASATLLEAKVRQI